MLAISKQEVLLPVAEVMPCEPQRLHLEKWQLSGQLGDKNLEEAAARLIIFSYEINEWVGVPWPMLVEQMKNDIDAHRRKVRITDSNQRLQAQYHSDVKLFWLRTIASAGVYSCFASKPTPPQEIPCVNGICPSVMFDFGVQFLLDGFKTLVRNGDIQVQSVDLGRLDGYDVYFPTAKLIEKVS